MILYHHPSTTTTIQKDVEQQMPAIAAHWKNLQALDSLKKTIKFNLNASSFTNFELVDNFRDVYQLSDITSEEAPIPDLEFVDVVLKPLYTGEITLHINNLIIDRSLPKIYIEDLL